jgi:elongator complex protein 4
LPLPMSSFKRKANARQTNTLLGTRKLQTASSTVVTSTGIPSLDDILGGGLPLSCLLVTLAPDPHSSYAQLVQKYFTAQGLVSGQDVLIVAEDGRSFAQECMWMPASQSSASTVSYQGDPELENESTKEKIVIAWRYEKLKQFQTTSNEYVSSHTCHSVDP